MKVFHLVVPSPQLAVKPPLSHSLLYNRMGKKIRRAEGREKWKRSAEVVTLQQQMDSQSALEQQLLWRNCTPPVLLLSMIFIQDGPSLQSVWGTCFGHIPSQAIAHPLHWWWSRKEKCPLGLCKGFSATVKTPGILSTLFCLPALCGHWEENSIPARPRTEICWGITREQPKWLAT